MDKYQQQHQHSHHYSPYQGVSSRRSSIQFEDDGGDDDLFADEWNGNKVTGSGLDEIGVVDAVKEDLHANHRAIMELHGFLQKMRLETAEFRRAVVSAKVFNEENHSNEEEYDVMK